MINTYKITYSTVTTIRKKLKQKNELLNTRKKRKRGKRVAIKGKFVFITKEVLKVVQNTETAVTVKNTRKRPRQRFIEHYIDKEEDEVSESETNNSESDCIVIKSSK